VENLQASVSLVFAFWEHYRVVWDNPRPLLDLKRDIAGFTVVE
jgi:hypothetical protein